MPFAPLWFRYLGRVVAPIFFFLAVEGFSHTRSRPRYMARLFGAGLIMSIGSSILTHIFPTSSTLPNNIFFSLGLGVALMSTLEWSRESDSLCLGILAVLLLVGASLFTEAHLYGVMMILVFYFFRQRTDLLIISYIMASLLPALAGSHNLNQLLFHNYQWMMVFALPFLLLYNGEPGPRTSMTKWFFYVFYPVHLWVIYWLSYLIART